MKQILRRALMVLPTKKKEYSNQELQKTWLGWIELRGLGTTLAFISADGDMVFNW